MLPVGAVKRGVALGVGFEADDELVVALAVFFPCVVVGGGLELVGRVLLVVVLVGRGAALVEAAGVAFDGREGKRVVFEGDISFFVDERLGAAAEGSAAGDKVEFTRSVGLEVEGDRMAGSTPSSGDDFNGFVFVV
ncbi:MAG: hypothetical protein ICV83_22710 [Cytophagales bacterium]|nr:hypothetical protein [Cytophagales bacterium]